MVSLQQLGAFVGCFLIWPITRRYGRRIPLSASAFVFVIGAMIQTINTHSLPAFYVGRVIAGLGLGAATVIVPMYSAEMTHKDQRARLGCFFQLFYTIGIFTSYWVNYGIKKNYKATTQQWQIPVGLQILPAGLLCIGVLTLKESARWLTAKGRHDEAWKSLTWARGSDDSVILTEMSEIRAGVDLEIRETDGFKLSGKDKHSASVQGM